MNYILDYTHIIVFRVPNVIRLLGWIPETFFRQSKKRRDIFIKMVFSNALTVELHANLVHIMLKLHTSSWYFCH